MNTEQGDDVPQGPTAEGDKNLGDQTPAVLACDADSALELSIPVNETAPANPEPTAVALASQATPPTSTHLAEPPETMLMFQPDTYLALFPYCQAILSPTKVLEKDDEIESIGIYVPAMTIAELDAIASAPGQEHARQTAKATLQMIAMAARNKSPYLERESCADISELRQPMGTNLKDERIHAAAKLLQDRGSKLIIVTDENYLQSKLSLMKLQSMSSIEFLNRFYWLTSTVNELIIENLHTIGEEAMLRFAQLVATSIVWKGTIALMAPLPMCLRLVMFPPKPLEGVLQDIDAHKERLQNKNKTFEEVVSFDQVNKTNTLLEKFHSTPASLERTENFLAFLEGAITLCQPIANMFVNMTTRVSLLDTISHAFNRLVFPNSSRPPSPPMESATVRVAESTESGTESRSSQGAGSSSRDKPPHQPPVQPSNDHAPCREQ